MKTCTCNLLSNIDIKNTSKMAKSILKRSIGSLFDFVAKTYNHLTDSKITRQRAFYKSDIQVPEYQLLVIA